MHLEITYRYMDLHTGLDKFSLLGQIPQKIQFQMNRLNFNQSDCSESTDLPGPWPMDLLSPRTS